MNPFRGAPCRTGVGAARRRMPAHSAAAVLPGVRDRGAGQVPLPRPWEARERAGVIRAGGRRSRTARRGGAPERAAGPDGAGGVAV